MISSAQNAFVKSVVGLKERKNRDSSKLFVIEGEKFVKELPPDWQVCDFVLAEGFSGDISWYERHGAGIRRVTDAVFRLMSDTVTPQGVLAVVRQKEYALDLVSGVKQPFILMCEDIQDPGNLGTLLRTADAAGCDCVILSKGSADVYNPKVLRASAGSVFHVPVVTRVCIREAIDLLKQHGISVMAADPADGKPARETDFSVPCAVLIGNEGNGISQAAMALATSRVRIPMPGRAESLNASVAGAILMYEVIRQRGGV